VTLLCVSVAASQGQVRRKHTVLWQPTTIAGPQRLPPATVHEEMIGSLRVADVQVVLDETRWEDVQKRLGGTIGHSGDAGESLTWLCFHGSDAQGGWVFWLQGGEVNGDSVGGIQWLRMASGDQTDSRCRRLEQKRDVELPIRLRLGMTRAEVTATLGAPTVQQHDVLTYLYEHTETVGDTPFTASNTLEIVLRDGVVCAIEAWRTTVN
jgi:hypothetical protein